MWNGETGSPTRDLAAILHNARRVSGKTLAVVLTQLSFVGDEASATLSRLMTQMDAVAAASVAEADPDALRNVASALGVQDATWEALQSRVHS
mmetsp:Transcript_23076/g.54479  ORF Transcript_23076/g.54479 Transcript_23076/m.54479 type:complete len:93 (+) Transcript_23076:231-509(+)